MLRFLMVILLVALAVPAGAAACGPRDGTTVARNKQVRVYWTGDVHNKRYFACPGRRGRSLELARDRIGDRGDTGLENFRLAGRFVAFSWRNFDRYTGDITLHVERVHVSGGRRQWVFEWMNLRNSPRDPVGLHGLRLMRDGGFGFVVGRLRRPDSSPSEYTHQVWANGRVVDDGLDIDLASFRAAPGGIAWTRSGERRTARLR